MKENSGSQELLMLAIGERLPKLSEKERLEITKILSDYIDLLDKGKIEEAGSLIQKNLKQLAKII